MNLVDEKMWADAVMRNQERAAIHAIGKFLLQMRPQEQDSEHWKNLESAVAPLDPRAK